MNRNGFGLRQGYFAVEDGIRHGISGFHNSVHRIQVCVQLIQVGFDAIHVTVCRHHLHCLNVVAIVMPPAPHFAVHIVHFLIVGFNQLPLVGGNALVNLL